MFPSLTGPPPKALLLVPSASVYDFFDRQAHSLSNETLPYLIGYCARASLSHVESDEDRATLLLNAVRLFCTDFWYPTREGISTTSKPKILDGNDLVNVLKASLELGDYDNFNDACLMHGDVVPPTFFTWAKNWLKDPSTDSDFDDFLEEGYVLHQQDQMWKLTD